MSFVAVRRKTYRQYRPALGLPDPGQLIGGSDGGGDGSSITSLISSIGKAAGGIFSATSAAKAAPAKGAPAASSVGPLAGVSTGTIVGIGLGFSALILVLASRGSR
jgi:hypothetical protein